MTGIVQGGWNFVIAAYSVTGLAFVLYAVTLIARYRDERARAMAEGDDV